ncbi:MAG: hypothetical protein ACYS76_09660 [Planctomycetota bacterium]
MSRKAEELILAKESQGWQMSEWFPVAGRMILARIRPGDTHYSYMTVFRSGKSKIGRHLP